MTRFAKYSSEIRMIVGANTPFRNPVNNCKNCKLVLQITRSDVMYTLLNIFRQCIVICEHTTLNHNDLRKLIIQNEQRYLWAPPFSCCCCCYIIENELVPCATWLSTWGLSSVSVDVDLSFHTCYLIPIYLLEVSLKVLE